MSCSFMPHKRDGIIRIEVGRDHLLYSPWSNGMEYGSKGAALVSCPDMSPCCLVDVQKHMTFTVCKLLTELCIYCHLMKTGPMDRGG